jgi:predicted ATP-dependent serine protease
VHHHLCCLADTQVDLGGGLRPVKCLDLRLAELRKQGLRRVYFPQVRYS